MELYIHILYITRLSQIRFSLKDLVYFQKLDKIVRVNLTHQHRDGHVSETKLISVRVITICSIAASCHLR